ncbi:sigma-70 family RNA polymerase sigma factor [Phyllobacterium leguminum]|uniref:RNA polymerase sigma-70 factor (ECF subfamily) n=1 Tax=Phyllobacterium leguminum TaxID=314237 RepID=A0A318T0X9_9HYPH|nr:sigma-70 family RNA polymerase sigma factor [Phyllobacterium leguminum]PYE87399.1 RNA polymerase sigma-70 factor (ECF subfamily) [Phyllobacterium leguminum]
MPSHNAVVDLGAAFETLRPRLIRIAYRMLGSVAEAEDIVQDAWLRWTAKDRASVRDPKAFLARIVTRLCLDHMKSARVRRETYPGTWLPEPVVELVEDEDDDLTLTLMMALERLSPLERAAFLLHDVFDVNFEEVASILDRDPASCRKLASRARDHVRESRPRYPVPEDRGRSIAEAFFQASRSGDPTALQSLLAEDVIIYSDGGGIRSAALNPIYGRDKTVRFFVGIAEKAGMPPVHRIENINGLPGIITIEADDLPQTVTLDIKEGLITAIYIMRNPDKLRHLMV